MWVLGLGLGLGTGRGNWVLVLGVAGVGVGVRLKPYALIRCSHSTKDVPVCPPFLQVRISSISFQFCVYMLLAWSPNVPGHVFGHGHPLPEKTLEGDFEVLSACREMVGGPTFFLVG